MIPIFCIHLDRATERKSLIKQRWIEGLDLDINFWPAYDRRNIADGSLLYPFNYSEGRAVSCMGRALNEGEIACAISFCMLYQHILANNIEECIVMEDDVIPLVNNKDEIIESIKRGKEEFESADVMILHQPAFIDTMNHPTSIYYHKKTHFSLCHAAPWGNLCLYVNIRAAKDIYEILKTLNYVADYPQRKLAIQNRVIIANKPICQHYEPNNEETKTYIGNDFRQSNRKFIA
jgi:GR25 family glycosyltransferase involved in LPS biosynthesis